MHVGPVCTPPHATLHVRQAHYLLRQRMHAVFADRRELHAHSCHRLLQRMVHACTVDGARHRMRARACVHVRARGPCVHAGGPWALCVRAAGGPQDFLSVGSVPLAHGPYVGPTQRVA